MRLHYTLSRSGISKAFLRFNRRYISAIDIIFNLMQLIFDLANSTFPNLYIYIYYNLIITSATLIICDAITMVRILKKEVSKNQE